MFLFHRKHIIDIKRTSSTIKLKISIIPISNTRSNIYRYVIVTSYIFQMQQLKPYTVRADL